jgi:hypothetical protein
MDFREMKFKMESQRSRSVAPGRYPLLGFRQDNDVAKPKPNRIISPMINTTVPQALFSGGGVHAVTGHGPANSAYWRTCAALQCGGLLGMRGSNIGG